MLQVLVHPAEAPVVVKVADQLGACEAKQLQIFLHGGYQADLMRNGLPLVWLLSPDERIAEEARILHHLILENIHLEPCQVG